MTSPTPLIQRLQSHQANTRRMLTPGLKSRADQQRSFSPVLEGLGAQKYTQIAQNMRFLGKDRLGFIQPEAINLIGRSLPEKFTNLSGLLHIKAPATPDANIWSEVEQILPTGAQQHSPAAAQTPEEPGTLRQGSIIQRMQTFPKPGQSIEAFKEQVKSRAVSQKPASPARKLPQAGDPAVRRYARIEEIRSKEAAAKPEPPATTPPTVQRQQDTNLQTPDRPDADSRLHAVDERQTPAQLAPLSEPSAPSEAQAPGQPAPVSKSLAPPQMRTSEPPAPALKSPAVPETHTSAQPALSSEPRTTAQARASVPADKKPLARALPTARKTENAAPALPKGQPVSPKAATPAPAKASIAPPPRAAEVKPTPVARTTAPTLQRQPDLPAAAPKPVATPSDLASKPRSATPVEPHQPKPEQADTPTETSTGTKPVLPAAQPAPQPKETPLVAHLAQRRAASEQVRSLVSKTVKAKIADRPAMLRPNRLELRRSETPAPATSTPVHPTQGTPLSLASVQRQGSRAVSRQPEPAAAQQQSIEMPVARTHPAAPQSTFAPGGAQTLSALPANTFQPVPPTPAKESAPPVTQSQANPPIPAPQASAGNVVQRMWEEHSPPASASGRGSGAANQEDSQGEPALDLDKLAEDVLPIVKRLIEIETERSSGYLR